MDKLRIAGGRPLHGVVNIAGAKNAALPELCAALLTDKPVHLSNVPRLHDVQTMLQLLTAMGTTVQTSLTQGTVTLDACALQQPEVSYAMVKTMRAAILSLGPLLARYGRAKVSLPGGCAIGARPVDQHIMGLQAMGAQIQVQHGYIEAKLPKGQKRLWGARIATDMITVTGTENLMMAACLAQGRTILENAAREPEIVDLAEMLICMGAQISGHGTSRIVIDGVEALQGCSHRVIADRIEVGTFLCAVAATGGQVQLQGVCADHLEAVLEKLQDAGVTIRILENALHVHSEGASSVQAQNFRTTEYPGFPTDMQAQFMALNCVAQGTSVVVETIFENRFMHVNELLRLGANIQVEGKSAVVLGPARLSGATVMATDLRASASLVIAGLMAQGKTIIERIYHLDRGYDQMENKLRALGACIERVHG